MALLHNWLLPSFCAAVLTHPIWNWRFCWGRSAYLINTVSSIGKMCSTDLRPYFDCPLRFFFLFNNRSQPCQQFDREHEDTPELLLGTWHLFAVTGFLWWTIKLCSDNLSPTQNILRRPQSCCVCGQHLSHMFLNARGRDTLTLPRKSQMSSSHPDLEGMVFPPRLPPPTPPPTHPPTAAAAAAAAGGARDSQMVCASLHGSMCKKKKGKKETWIWLHNRK